MAHLCMAHLCMAHMCVPSLFTRICLLTHACSLGKKNPDSFKNFVEEAKIMKAMLGDSRQVRDPYDRGEHYAYSYSRNGPEIDNRPDCYDVDDAWFMDRTRGYSPGNVRSLSPPPKGTNRWMQTLSHVDSTCNFEEQTERQNTQQPVLSTRYSTIQLGKEWSKFRSDRYKKNVERKEEGERAEKHRGVMKAEKEEQERVIAGFEKRLRAMAEPGSNRKQGTDSDSDSDEEEEEEEGPRVPRDEQGEGGERPSSR